MIDSTRYKIFSIENGDNGTISEKELQRLEMFYRGVRADFLSKAQGSEASGDSVRVKELLLQAGEMDFELRKIDQFRIKHRSRITIK